MSRYLLPCECGQKLEVSGAQAGEALACGSCGRTVVAPTLRGMQQLERVAEPQTAAPPRRWGVRQGLCFLGLALAVTGVGLLIAATVIPRKTPLDVLRASEPKLSTPTDYYNEWSLLRNYGLPRKPWDGMSREVFVQIDHEMRKAQFLNELMWLVGGIAGIVGVALAGAALLVPNRSRNLPPQRRE